MLNKKLMCAGVFFSHWLVAIARSRCAMVEKWWWPKYWPVSIGNIIGYARSCCKFCHVFFLFSFSVMDASLTFFAWFEYTFGKKIMLKISSAIPAASLLFANYKLSIFQRRWRRCAVVALFFDSPEIRCFIIRPTWNCRNELFPRKPIIIWREWISSERSKKQQQRQAFFGPSTNQNNGSSSSLKLYRFNGVLLQLSANRE